MTNRLDLTLNAGQPSPASPRPFVAVHAGRSGFGFLLQPLVRAGHSLWFPETSIAVPSTSSGRVVGAHRRSRPHVLQLIHRRVRSQGHDRKARGRRACERGAVPPMLKAKPDRGLGCIPDSSLRSSPLVGASGGLHAWDPAYRRMHGSRQVRAVSLPAFASSRPRSISVHNPERGSMVLGGHFAIAP